MDIFELIQANNIKTIWEKDTNRTPYVGEVFFPNTRQKGLKFTFIKGKQSLPVALVSANFNTNVLYRDRIDIEALSGKLPFFKEAKKIDEDLRQEILSTKDEYAQDLINNVFNDNLELLEGADVTAERMRMQLLSTGTITIAENGVNKQYDYGYDSTKQFKTLTTLWSAAGADPLKDISNEIQNYADAHDGEEPTIIVMDKSLFRVIQNNSKVLEYFSKAQTPNLYPTYDDVLAFVEAKTGLTFVITNKSYIPARGATATKFYPTDRFTLLKDANLGQTVYGTTPEEADLLGGMSKANSVDITDKGVAITTWNEVDPVNVNTKVSEVVIPTCPQLENIYIVKAL